MDRRIDSFPALRAAVNANIYLMFICISQGDVPSKEKLDDYRHFIEGLKRKPQAFKGLAFRDALFPREAYRRTWEQLEAKLTQREACKTMVGLLEIAALDGVEAVLAAKLNTLLVEGVLPELKALREEFAPRQADCPVVKVEIPPVSSYDDLLTKGVAA